MSKTNPMIRINKAHNAQNDDYSNKMSRKNPISCVNKAHKYAKAQGTYYDDKTNTMLYGLSDNLRVTGVSDGTCNQINPMMLRQTGRCGAGAAGANPCTANNNDFLEAFCQSPSGCNINQFVAIIFLVLILVLVINMNKIYKQEQTSE